MSKEKSEAYALDEKEGDLSSPLEATVIDEIQAGDTALANAPWQYKLIALITALCFPSIKNNLDYQTLA